MKKELLQEYPVVIEIPVAWGEMDAFGHVNNAVYFRYFETARSVYFEQSGMFQLMKETGEGPILAAINCRFKLPVVYPDKLLVGVRVVSVEDDRYTINHRVVSTQHNRVAAEGDGLIVNYDYRAGKKMRLSAAMRRAMNAVIN